VESILFSWHYVVVFVCIVIDIGFFQCVQGSGVLRNHMLGSSSQRSPGQVRRRVSRMSSATLPAVCMALFCNITSGLYDIL
jgi:hypothetical protein